MKFDVLTIFPALFDEFRRIGLIGKALEKNLVALDVHNLRDFTDDAHKSVDDVPYGGGPGMVFKVEPVARAFDRIGAEREKSCRIYLSPRGRQLTQDNLAELLDFDQLILLCGRYEGVDQRLVDHYVDREISIGPYVLSGGELPAMALIEALSRLIPGVVGNQANVNEDSFTRGGLKYPQYTRPAEFRGHAVPPVLLSGHQAKIDAWREEQAERLSRSKD